MKKVLIIVIGILIFFLNMCIRYIPENHYILLDDKKISVEKEDKIISDNNLKNVRLLSDATILFEFYSIPNNLVLERVELFYQSKMIGSIDINEK